MIPGGDMHQSFTDGLGFFVAPQILSAECDCRD